MPLIDYAETLDRLQKGLAARYAKDSGVLNAPGSAVACKIDQNYWLVVEPLFSQSLAAWSGVAPEAALETLVRTGNMISRAEADGSRSHTLRLRVSWPSRPEGLDVEAGFVLAEFMERALAIYARTDAAHALSDLRVKAAEQERVLRFFEGKTLPGRWMYDDRP